MRALVRAMRAMLTVGSSLLGAGLLVTWPTLSAQAAGEVRAASGTGVSIGVGIQANPVRLATAAHPGSSYTLPAVYVVNTGTETESISIAVRRMGTARAAWDVPRSWIQAGTVPAQLTPGQAMRITLELTTPQDARAGRYASDIVVTGSAGTGTGSQVRFGAAAATALEFSVTPAAPHGYPAWKIWVILAILLLTAATIVVRHTGLRIRIERRRPPGGTHA